MGNLMNIDENILLKYFSNALLPQERIEVEQWIAQSAENSRLAKDIYYIYLSTKTMQIAKSVDTSSVLQKVKKKVNRHKKQTYLGVFQKIAAIVFLPLLLSTLYFSLKEGPVEYVEIKTNPGVVTKVNLPDGSEVWLNSASYLRHPSQFTGKTRTVLLDGEAYFSVSKDKSKRFVVNTLSHVKAEVLGTEFNMEAYGVDSTITTALVSGSVRLKYMDDKNEEQAIVMRPNEEAVYQRYTQKMEHHQAAYLPSQTAWKDGVVIFKNTPFKEALRILSKRFNVEFIVKNDVLYENSFTGPFDSQHLQLILEHFRLSSDIQYRFVDPEVGNGKDIMEKTVVELY